MSIFNGIVTRWSYNSTDDITKPLSIEFVQSRGAHTDFAIVGDNLNITRGTYRFKVAAYVAEDYGLNFLFDNEVYGVNGLRVSFSPDDSSTVSINSATAAPSHTSAVSTGQAVSNTTDQSFGSSTDSAQVHEAASETTRGGLSRDAKIGTGIGVSIATVIIAGCLILFYRLHCRRRVRESQQEPFPVSTPTEDGWSDSRPELDGKSVRPVSELPS